MLGNLLDSMTSRMNEKDKFLVLRNEAYILVAE